MMQYLVILLDDTSVSYCHCDNPHKERRLISLNDLRKGILYAMKQNLMIQFVYPDYELPQEYLDVIDTIDHHDIVPYGQQGDVVVVDGSGELERKMEELSGTVCALRLKKEELFAIEETMAVVMTKTQRLNIVITDVETFTDEDIQRYGQCLERWAAVLKEEYLSGRTPQVNVLTDRMMLTKPNHCSAGVENITLASNGKYYICPAFYYSHPEESIDPQNIANAQLLRREYAPLCRHCDAYHCRRCVWLNRKTTLEVNTPSREQCVVAHTERHASRRLLEAIREKAAFMPEVDIQELKYNDPFDVRKEW